MNVTKKNVVVFDLDNCLAEDGSRMHLIPGADKNGRVSAVEAITCKFAVAEQSRWDAYHKAGENSRGHHHEEFYAAAESLPKGCGVVVFLTARPQKYTQETVAWLRDNGFAAVPRWALVMRHDTCLAPSPIMKTQRLSDWLCDNNMTFDNVACVYDDRVDVLQAFEKLGVQTRRLAIEDR